MERLTERDEFGNADIIGVNSEDLQLNLDFKQMNKVTDTLNKLAEYEDLEEQGLLLRLPCKVGDTVYVDSSALPIEDMECYEDVDNPIPSYFPSRVVSFRFAKRNWVKVSVKTKWLYEWVDDETGPDCDYREYEKSISFPLSMFGKIVFLTKEQAEEKLKELRGEQNDRE